jgi:hypothetical protein
LSCSEHKGWLEQFINHRSMFKILLGHACRMATKTCEKQDFTILPLIFTKILIPTFVHEVLVCRL